MQSYLLSSRTVFAGLLAVGLFACDDNDVKPNLRTAIDYSVLTPQTNYSELFVDADGNTTVDFSEGNDRHKMFQALNFYSSSISSKYSSIVVRTSSAAVLDKEEATTVRSWTFDALS